MVDPWKWSRAEGATDGERALEDIGAYQQNTPTDAHRDAQKNDNASVAVNTNADYWTRLVGIAWDRDIELSFDNEPVDLDGDSLPDTRLSRHLSAPGGILANPELFGLTRTPEDPRGRVGKISISTGVLGLREALSPDGRPSGQIGMTCFLCHGGANPVDGRLIPGLAGTRFDYGLLLATARVLDDGDPVSVAYRQARGFPSGRAVRARLLLAGPGRQDLTAEFGLDITVPGFHSASYRGTARVRQRPGGVVNPISVPSALGTDGLALQNWSGSENSDGPWLERLLALAQQPPAAVLAAFGLAPDERALARRELLLDLRNLGTLGLQHDAWPALQWADALYGRATISADELTAIPSMFAIQAVRRTLVTAAATLQRPAGDTARIARGRALFSDRIVGVIANQQILKTVPPAYAAAKLTSEVGLVILTPLDPSQPLQARLPVRCADCHNMAPLDRRVALADHPPPLGRCTHCHRAHPSDDSSSTVATLPIARLSPPARATAEVAFCTGCHSQHRDWGPLAYSSSQLLPFDADGDGNAQGDEADDLAAGGIGTESLLAFDVPRGQRPGGRFGIDVPVIGDPRRAGKVTTRRLGVSWVRVAPLQALFASAPYLHNGAVPTLRALLEPAARRPVTFPLGNAGFVLDTRIPGNGNRGHHFGTRLSPSEKDDLVAFLNSL